MNLSKAQKEILSAMTNDQFLKAHRDIEGSKIYKLHPLNGEAVTVSGDDVQRLCDLDLIDSNKKFPAATFWLTEKGKSLISNL